VSPCCSAAAVPPLGNRVHEPCVREHAEVPADRVRVQVDALGELRVQALVLAPQSLEDRLPLELAVHALILARTYHDGIRGNYRFASAWPVLRCS
jgi:hypothetical protein